MRVIDEGPSPLPPVPPRLIEQARGGTVADAYPVEGDLLEQAGNKHVGERNYFHDLGGIGLHGNGQHRAD